MADGLNPIVKRYLKGNVESHNKNLAWETDDFGFLFIVDGKYFEVPYKEFIYDGPDQAIQLTADVIIDCSIVGVFRTMAVYCSELLLHPETFAYYDKRLVTDRYGKMLSGAITTRKGSFQWRMTSESVEIDSKPRTYMMYVSHKYYTKEIWELLAPQIPFNVCQMFITLSKLYMRCVKFEEPEVELSLEEIKHNIEMKNQVMQRKKEMEEMKRAEEEKRRQNSSRNLGGGVDIELGSGGSLYPGTASFGGNSAASKSVASSQGVDLSPKGQHAPGHQVPQGGQIPPNQQVPQRGQMPPNQQMLQGGQIPPNQQMPQGGQMPQDQQIPQPQQPAYQEMPVAEGQPLYQENVQAPPEQMFPNQQMPQEQGFQNQQIPFDQQVYQEQEAQNQQMLQEEQDTQMYQERALSEDVQQIMQEPVEELAAQDALEDDNTIPLPIEEIQEILEQEAAATAEVADSYMDIIMAYLTEMDLPTKNPERSVRKYYPEWALKPIENLTGEEFLRAFAELLG